MRVKGSLVLVLVLSPARSRRSASHAAGTHGWLPLKKLGDRGSGEAG